MQIRLEQPKGQERAIDRFFAQVYEEFLQRHRLIVNGDDQMAQLRKEELNLPVAEAS